MAAHALRDAMMTIDSEEGEDQELFDEDLTDLEEDILSQQTDAILKFEFFATSFPDIDEEYLRNKCQECAFDENQFNHFVENVLLKGLYPKKGHKVPAVSQSKSFQEEAQQFSVEALLKRIPNPDEYFSRNSQGYKYSDHSLMFLLGTFRYVSATVIKRELLKNNQSLYLTYMRLIGAKPSRSTPRKNSEYATASKQPPDEFTLEALYILHRVEIAKYLEDEQIAKATAIEEARKAQALLECGCCFNDELLAEESLTCTEGHIFCRDCLTKSAEIQIGDGSLEFPCLQDCPAYFHTDTLKLVLNAKTYEKLLRQLQQNEVKAANISGLESCPSCEYAVIPSEGSSLFYCPMCDLESCRLCRRISHTPLRCDEVDSDNDEVKQRTYVEEKMTEALVRNCWRCNQKFIREDGCNKMSCKCGAKMCYICRERVTGYSHFYESGGPTSTRTCPLWTNNNKLHRKEVQDSAKMAIEELKRKNPGVDINIFKKQKY